jgi:hypothetical protein
MQSERRENDWKLPGQFLVANVAFQVHAVRNNARYSVPKGFLGGFFGAGQIHKMTMGIRKDHAASNGFKNVFKPFFRLMMNSVLF